MKTKKGISAVLSAAMLASSFTGIMIAQPMTALAWDANTTGIPAYKSTARQMEKLDRGLIAVYRDANTANGITENGVYLSWRLLGDESLTSQAFDVYRSDSETGEYTKIGSSDAAGATNYIDVNGTADNYYKVLKSGTNTSYLARETAVKPSSVNITAGSNSITNGNEKNSYTYVDIPINRPDPVSNPGGSTSEYYTYRTTNSDGETVIMDGGANDASVGDLDGDGDYEIILKWNPYDAKDSASNGYTGNVYIDAYDFDFNGKTELMWRIDLGQNVTAGAHYTQFIVYDFDGDGRAEIAMQTAPGSKDGNGSYVTEVGDTTGISDKNFNNKTSYLGSNGKNISGYEFYTIFDGETGAALCTVDGIPLGKSSDWGDDSYNRCMRFLAGVAYLDGVNPSLIECRGYYQKAVVRAYNFERMSDTTGTLTEKWEHVGSSSGTSSLYGQGNHNLSIADIDNDGYDEIVYGSAALDQDGTVMGNTRLGHGDALHVNDFDNDGVQEAFSVKEDSVGYKNNAADFRDPATGSNIWKSGASGDTGRGVMDNIDDDYALANPETGLALAWTSSHDNTFDLNGETVAAKPKTSSRTMTNFLVYWDGDLGRELLDDNQLTKYNATTGSAPRFYSGTNGYLPATSNNGSKATPSLVADIWGDWREEIIMPINKTSPSNTYGEPPTEQAYLRIFTSTLPTDYRLTTLMHDSQYRCAIAWQNVAYNQPPHTSYYIGSAALANATNAKYLAPQTLFTKAHKDGNYDINGPAVASISLPATLSVSGGSTKTLTATVSPDNAAKQTVKYYSSDPSVATVSNDGTVTGISNGTAIITAYSWYYPEITATCTVTVETIRETGIELQSTAAVGLDQTVQLTATVTPENASNKTVTWVSSDESVATVNANGKVTGKSLGLAQITATTENGYSAVCNVSVNPVETKDITNVDADGTNGIWKTDNTDTQTQLSNNTASTADFAQTAANSDGNFYRTFEKLSGGTAELTFTFSTGGQQDSSGAWNWEGREYSFYVKLLGADEQNIITLSQAYTTSAQNTMYKAGSGSTGLVSSWNVNGTTSDSALSRSSTTWYLTFKFDYDNDTCTVSLMNRSKEQTYSTSFALNGLTLEKLSIGSTVDGSGAITWTPTVSDLSYVKTAPAAGASSTIFERGTNAGTAWNEADLKATNLTSTGKDYAELKYSETGSDKDAYGLIYYEATKPSGSYSTEIKFDEISSNTSLILYELDWYFGSNLGDESNYEYIKFGNTLTFGWNSNYNVYISTNGGSTWLDKDGNGSADIIFDGGNSTYTKKIKLLYDQTNQTIEYISFGDTELTDYADYSLSDELMNTVTFGAFINGSTRTWSFPTGLDSIKVSQFAAGAEIPEPTQPEQPDPTEVSLLSENFDAETVGENWILQMGTTVDLTETYKGLELKVGHRTDGDKSLGFRLVNDDGNKVLSMESGNFCNTDRGPRFRFNTPSTLNDDTIYTASMNVKLADANAVLYYGDELDTQATNTLSTDELTMEQGTWYTVTVTIAKTATNTTRTITLSNGTTTVQLLSDNNAKYPVFWGTGDYGANAKVYIDNLSVTSLEVKHAAVNGTAAGADIVKVPAVVYYGQTDNNGTITENTDDAASLADDVTIKAGNVAVTGIGAYNGATQIGSNAECSIAAGSEAVIAVILDQVSTTEIGIKVIE